MEAGLWGWQGPGMLDWAALNSRGAPGTEKDVRLARRQPPGPSWLSPPSGRSTHPEPRLGRAVPKATGFRFSSVWKPAENKPGRQGSPRASGFLEDATASPVKVAVTGAPRESHVFRRGSRSQGSRRSQRSRSGAARGRPNRPVTQQHARQLRGRRRPLPRSGAARPRGF